MKHLAVRDPEGAPVLPWVVLKHSLQRTAFKAKSYTRGYEMWGVGEECDRPFVTSLVVLFVSD